MPTLLNTSSPGGDQLFDGDKEFRFVSFNIPNLHQVEDDFRPRQGDRLGLAHRV